MNDKLKRVIELAVTTVLSRSGDVDTEDGSKATVCTDEIIRLEAAISEAFELSSDDVNDSDVEIIAATLKSI